MNFELFTERVIRRTDWLCQTDARLGESGVNCINIFFDYDNGENCINVSTEGNFKDNLRKKLNFLKQII